jgi:DNA-binding MarR family transcriptional regulator
VKDTKKKTIAGSIRNVFQSRKDKGIEEKHRRENPPKEEKSPSAGSEKEIDSDVVLNMYSTVSTFYRQTLVFLHRQAIEEGLDGINPLMLMTILRNEGIGQDELAKKIRFDKGAMARTIRQLVEKGYLIRVRDPEDGRKYNLHTTEKCKELTPALEKIALQYEKVIHGNMTTEQVLVMRSLMEKASENLFRSNKEHHYAAESESHEY